MNPLHPSVVAEPIDYIIELKTLLERYANLLKDSGCDVKPYNQACLDRYGKLSRQDQKKIYDDFAVMASLAFALKDSAIPIKDSRQSIWRIFGFMGWKPTSDLFEAIEPNHVIEVYTLDNIQRYRSTNFFDYFTYSLGEIITYRWYELVHHSENKISEFMRISKDIANNKIKSTVTVGSEPFVTSELFSEGKRRVKSVLLGISPVMARDTDENVAAVVKWKLDLIK